MSFFFFLISVSYRLEKSELSIGEEIEEDFFMGVEDGNISDKVRGYSLGVFVYLMICEV